MSHHQLTRKEPLWTPNTAADTTFALAGGELFSAGKSLVTYAGSKIIGSAQSTGTLGHAFVSEATAYLYALNPNVVRVTMDLGYRRLMQGAQEMVGKWGPRPDVGALFKDGSVRITEVASKTDSVAALRARNELKMTQEGIAGTVNVNTWATRINKLFGLD